MTELLLVGLGLALIAACGVFVAAEFSFVTVDRAVVDRAVAGHEPGASGVRTAIRSLSTQLSSAQVGVTATNLAIGYLAEPALSRLLAGPFGAAGVPDSVGVPLAVGLALVLATGLTMVFGELVPKNLAIAHPLGVAKAVQGPQRAFTTATRPLTVACNGVANALLRLFGVEPREELPSARAPEELASLVRRSAEAGTLARSTAHLVERTLRFDEKIAADVLTPRTRTVSVRESDPVQRVVDLARTKGLSRFPVVARGLDDIAGVVRLVGAAAVPPGRRRSTKVRAIMVPAVFVPHSIPLDELLWRLRDEDAQLAVVLDEYGGNAGIVTFEDLVEEIVGSVEDEHDRRQVPVRRGHGDSWVLSGLLRPDEVQDATGVRLPEPARGHETVAGLVLERLGRVPRAGDEVEIDGVRLSVERMDRHRVDRLRLVAPADPEPAGELAGERAREPDGEREAER